jgi:hypothetical protein
MVQRQRVSQTLPTDASLGLIPIPHPARATPTVVLRMISLPTGEIITEAADRMKRPCERTKHLCPHAEHSATDRHQFIGIAQHNPQPFSIHPPTQRGLVCRQEVSHI